MSTDFIIDTGGGRTESKRLDDGRQKRRYRRKRAIETEINHTAAVHPPILQRGDDMSFMRKRSDQFE